MRQTNLEQYFKAPSGKRKKTDSEDDEDDSAIVNDAFGLLMAKLDGNQEELRAMNSELREASRVQTSKIDDLREEVSTKLEAVDARVGSLETTIGQATSDISTLQQKLDELEQDKLATHMEISGIEKAAADANKSDAKGFAIQLISSFNIELDISSIDQAFFQATRDEKRRLVVVFASVDIKVEVMKKKREAKDPRKIFFDHRMTFSTRKLFLSARKVAKEVGGRVFLYGGRVFYGKDKTSKVRISSASDFSKILPTNPQ